MHQAAFLREKIQNREAILNFFEFATNNAALLREKIQNREAILNFFEFATDLFFRLFFRLCQKRGKDSDFFFNFTRNAPNIARIGLTPFIRTLRG